MQTHFYLKIPAVRLPTIEQKHRVVFEQTGMENEVMYIESSIYIAG